MVSSEVAYSNALPQRNAKTYLEREFFPFQREKLTEPNLQTHGTAMGTKMAASFANIFMAEGETDIIYQSPNKPLIWKTDTLTTYFRYGTQTKRQ